MFENKKEYMKDNTALKAIIVVVVLAGLVGGTIALTRDDSPDTQPAITSTNQTDTPQQTRPSETNTSEYVDGTYSATGTYTTPGGPEDITVTVTLEDDLISSVNVQKEASSPTSSDFQESFAEGIASLVTGVDIDEADVDLVAGSSLTSRGFNEALEQIRQEAQS